MILYIYMLIAHTHTKENGGRNKVNKKNCTHISPPFQVREEERFRKNGFLFVVRRFGGRFFLAEARGGIFTQMHDGNRPRAGFPLRDAMPPPPPPPPDTCSL